MAKTRFIYTTDETIVPGATELRPQQIPNPPSPPERFSDDENITKIVYAKSGTKTLVFALVKSDELRLRNGPAVNPLYSLYLYDPSGLVLMRRNESNLSSSSIVPDSLDKLGFYPMDDLSSRSEGWQRLSFGQSAGATPVVSIHKIKKASGPEELNIYNENIIVVLYVNNEIVFLNMSLDVDFIDLEMDVRSEWSVVSQTLYGRRYSAYRYPEGMGYYGWHKTFVVRYLDFTNTKIYKGKPHLGPGFFANYNRVLTRTPDGSGPGDSFYETPAYIPTSSIGESAYGPDLKLFRIVSPSCFPNRTPFGGITIPTCGSPSAQPVSCSSVNGEQCPKSFQGQSELPTNSDPMFETGHTYDKSLELRSKYGNETRWEFNAFNKFMKSKFNTDDIQTNIIFNDEFPDYDEPNHGDWRRIPADRIAEEMPHYRLSANVYDGNLDPRVYSNTVASWNYAPVPHRFFVEEELLNSTRLGLSRTPEGTNPRFDLVDYIRLKVRTRSQYATLDFNIIPLPEPLIKKIICFDDYKKVYAICSQVSEPNNSLYRIT